MENDNNHTAGHSSEYSPLIRESIEASLAILITHGHRITPPPVSPSAIKHFTTWPIKKFQQFNPLSQGDQYRLARDWIVPRQSRLHASTRVEFSGFCATGRTFLLVAFSPKGLVHQDRVNRSQKWTIPEEIRRISNFYLTP